MGRAIIVLGMHRSGTSAVAGLMGLLGAYLGPDDHMMSPGLGNPKGFFEFSPFVGVNEGLLSRAGMGWDCILSKPPDWANGSEFVDLKLFASNCVQEYFSKADIWLIKDPRCCITLPFWVSVIPAPLEVVLVFRHPLEVADSLASRDEFSRDKSLMLWAAYVTASIRHSSGLRRHVMFYEDLLEAPEAEVERLRAFAVLPAPDADRRREINGFMERDLRHHRRTRAEMVDRVDLPSGVVRLFQELRSYVDLARKGDAEDSALDRIVGES